MQVCSKCDIEKCLEEFHKHPSTKNGRNTICKSCRSAYMKTIYVYDPERYRNPEHESKRKREYYSRNRQARIDYSKTYIKQRKKTDLDFKLRGVLRSRISTAIKRNPKAARTMELIGCSIPELRRHLESQFEPGMTWDNHSVHGWHIDHILPCKHFDLTDPEQQKICFHYTNLQPMWAKDNLSKGDKII